jgi:hypothetical protein
MGPRFSKPACYSSNFDKGIGVRLLRRSYPGSSATTAALLLTIREIGAAPAWRRPNRQAVPDRPRVVAQSCAARLRATPGIPARPPLSSWVADGVPLGTARRRVWVFWSFQWACIRSMSSTISDRRRSTCTPLRNAACSSLIDTTRALSLHPLTASAGLS